MNRETIKYCAMITMFLNHGAELFVEHGMLYELLTDIGYFTAITMCYFLVEGYEYTHSKMKYAQRLFVFGVISQVPFFLMKGYFKLNMMFTLLICFVILWVMENVRDRTEKIISIIALTLCSVFCDWALLAPVFTILFALSKGNKKRTALSYMISVIMYAGLDLILSGIFPLTGQDVIHISLSCVGLVLSGIVILCFYNGKRSPKAGKFTKWFFYVFYPAHIMLLWVIKNFI